MNTKELEKTYGIRIPVPEYSDYYINSLLKGGENHNLKRDILAYEKFEKSLGEETEKSFKYKLIEKSVLYLKTIMYDKVNSWSAPEPFILETKEFKPEDGKCYISFDVRQANWTVSKYFLGLDLPIWEEYSQSVLEFPEALSYSKPLRQAILGQVVNPKRYDAMQKYLTWKHLQLLNSVNDSKLSEIISINSEEIIMEVKKGDNRILEYLNQIPWKVPVKFSIYDIKIHNNYGDNIVVKEFLNDKWELTHKSMFGVNGHRYYIHYKTLILNEPLEDKDMLFKQEGKIFKWCGIDLKDFREYNYVKKWIKPLQWSNDYSAYVTKENVLYTVLEKKHDSIKIFDVREKEEHLLMTNKRYFKDVVSDYHYEKIQKYIEI